MRVYQESSVDVKEDFVEMEMDELNQHECMATLTALLQHMAERKITPPVEKASLLLSILPLNTEYTHSASSCSLISLLYSL